MTDTWITVNGRPVDGVPARITRGEGTPRLADTILRRERDIVAQRRAQAARLAQQTDKPEPDPD